MIQFAQRHKKKLIGSSVLIGGGYVAWRFLKPKLDEYLLQAVLEEHRTVKEIEDPKQAEANKAAVEANKIAHPVTREEIADPKRAEANKAAVEANKIAHPDTREEIEDPKQAEAQTAAVEENKIARFRSNQQVSDNHTRECLDILGVNLSGCFEVDKCSEALAKASSKQDKLLCIKCLQVECLARSTSAVLTLHLLLLFHRVEINIVGRDVVPSNGTPCAELLQCFAESDSYLQGEGLQLICDAVREAVKSCWNADGFKPMTKVSAEGLQNLFLNVFREVESSLMETDRGPGTLLPKTLGDDLSSRNLPKANQLLKEARDYLESAQCLQVFRTIVASAFEHFVEMLGEDCDEKKPPPLPSGTSVPIAKLGGDCLRISQLMVSSGDCAGFVESFGQDPIVAQLCEGLYFEKDME